MTVFRKIVPSAAIVTAILVSLAYQTDAAAPGPKVSAPGNTHNLSAANTANPYHAKAVGSGGDSRGEQICIFCHTPHNSNVAGQAPLWNRKFTTMPNNFQRYTSLTLNIRHIASAQYGVGAQPNGSSKICLSCHDGVSRLGEIFNGPEIPMTSPNISATSIYSFNPSLTNKMLSGHHPVSFVYLTGFSNSSQSGSILPELVATGSYRFIPISSAGKVKLFDTSKNGNGWMQCTTCHDPHQNQSDETGANTCYDTGGALGTCGGPYTRKVAPFWAYHGTNTTATQDTGTVCKVCHGVGSFGAPVWP